MYKRIQLAIVITIGSSALAMAQSIGDASLGEEAAQICTACHGANGISISNDIPNLAGQKDEYIVNQLNNFRSGDRQNDFMNPIASALSDDDINNLAAFFSELPHSSEFEVSSLGQDINTSRLSLPANYKEEFIEYLRKNADDGDQKTIRIFSANTTAIDALKANEPLPDGAFVVLETYSAKLDADGDPLTDENGVHVEDELTGIIAQKIVSGAGEEIPEALRNGDWIYGAYEPDGTHKGEANLAKCYACHKPQADNNFLFRFEQLNAHATQ